MKSKLDEAKEKLQNTLSEAYSDFYTETAIEIHSVEVQSSTHHGPKGQDRCVLVGIKVNADCPHLEIHREEVDISEVEIKDANCLDLLSNVSKVTRCSLCGKYMPIRYTS